MKDIAAELWIAERPHALVEHESSVVWLEDVGDRPYVREVVVLAQGRQDVPAWDGEGRMVGYVTLGLMAVATRPGYFLRQCFWLHDDHDGAGCVYRFTGRPLEGVAPSSVKPGRWGERPSCRDDAAAAIAAGLMDAPADDRDHA